MTVKKIVTILFGLIAPQIHGDIIDSLLAFPPPKNPKNATISSHRKISMTDTISLNRQKEGSGKNTSRSLDSIDHTVRRGISEVNEEYQYILKDNPYLSGKISLHFVIEPSGSVSYAKIDSSTILNNVFERDIEYIFSKLLFEKEKAAKQIIRKTLTFDDGCDSMGLYSLDVNVQTKLAKCLETKSGKKYIRQIAKIYESAAIKGDAESQYSFGAMLYYGRGVNQDKLLGLKWILKAAEGGSMNAQIFVGNSYYSGNGFAMDKSLTLFWYTKAAIQGNSDAQYSVCVMYINGTGTHKDLNTAKSFCKMAADQGNKKAIITVNEIENPPPVRKAGRDDFSDLATWDSNAGKKTVVNRYYEPNGKYEYINPDRKSSRCETITTNGGDPNRFGTHTADNGWYIKSSSGNSTTFCKD